MARAKDVRSISAAVFRQIEFRRDRLNTKHVVSHNVGTHIYVLHIRLREI